MLIESQSDVRPTTWHPVWHTGPDSTDQSIASFNASRVIPDGKDSLAASLEAAWLQDEMMKLVWELYFERMTEASNRVLLGAQFFPQVVDLACFQPATAEQAVVGDQEETRLANRLHAAFEAEPLEDGMHHPAEEIIATTLQLEEEQRVLAWLRAFSLDFTDPSFAASVLHCLGRQANIGDRSWRTELIRDGLAADDVEVRDATVQAAEMWSDRSIVTVLKSHSEPVPWLRDYIREVIADLGD